MENGLLCGHFGHCSYFAVATVKNNQVVELEEITPPTHEPGVYPRWIATMGVTDVIAGGMGQKAIDLFTQQNVNAYVGAPTKEAKTLIDDFLSGKLTLTVNSCNHDHDHHCNH